MADTPADLPDDTRACQLPVTRDSAEANGEPCTSSSVHGQPRSPLEVPPAFGAEGPRTASGLLLDTVTDGIASLHFAHPDAPTMDRRGRSPTLDEEDDLLSLSTEESDADVEMASEAFESHRAGVTSPQVVTQEVAPPESPLKGVVRPAMPNAVLATPQAAMVFQSAARLQLLATRCTNTGLSHIPYEGLRIQEDLVQQHWKNLNRSLAAIQVTDRERKLLSDIERITSQPKQTMSSYLA